MTLCCAVAGTGCGSDQVRTVTSRRASTATPIVSATSTAAAVVPDTAVAAFRTCSGESWGGAIPVSRLGAIDFFSPSDGVGLTAQQFACYPPPHHSGEVSFHAEPVIVVRTSDGGRTWTPTAGAQALASGHTGAVSEQLVAGTRTRLWVLFDAGRVQQSADGGRHWQTAAIPGPVVQLARAGRYVWALACLRVMPHKLPDQCRPTLWRSALDGDDWVEVSQPDATAAQPAMTDLALASATSMIVAVIPVAGSAPRDQLLISENGGISWTARPAPVWDRQRCWNFNLFVAVPPRTYWLLCVGNAAAGSSEKGLLRSTDGGRSWRTVAAVTSLTAQPAASALPLSEPSALAAGSATRLWLATQFGLVESGDAGRAWSDMRSVRDDWGVPTSLFVLDARHVWLLSSTVGLWRTYDGWHWHALGQVYSVG